MTFIGFEKFITIDDDGNVQDVDVGKNLAEAESSATDDAATRL